jgi:preprotein translocase subunit SecA
MDFLLNVEALPEKEESESRLGDASEILDAVVSATRVHFERKLEAFAEHAERLQSWLLLTVIDDKWKDHLYDLDSLKASISFRGWGQKDPLIEYKKEAYDMFVDLMKDVRRSVTSFFFRAQLGQPQAQRVRPVQRLQYTGPAEPGGAGVTTAAPAAGVGAARQARLDPVGVAAAARATAPEPDPARLQTNRGEPRAQQPVAVSAGPGRNDPCPCGSGKKYKKCHGAVG